MQDIKLGMKVKDIVSGFTGIVTSYTTFLNGCVRLCVDPPMKKNGDFVEPRCFDIQQLVIISAVTTATKMIDGLASTKKSKAKEISTGGPRPAVQRAQVPSRRPDPKR